MRWWYVLIAGVIATASANEITLPQTIRSGDTTYNQVVYVSHDGAFVRFTHDSGVARIRISTLPAELQKLLGYNKEAEQKALAADAARQKKVAASGEERKRQAELNQLFAEFKKFSEEIPFTIISVIDDGVIAQDGRYQDNPTIFIYGQKGFDGDSSRLTLWHYGAFSYTTTTGAKATVRAYAADPEQAFRLAQQQPQEASDSVRQ